METRLRILHVLVTLDRGGAENHVLDLALQQKAHGHEVSVAFLKGKGSLSPLFCEHGIGVFNLRMMFYGNPHPLYRLWRITNEIQPDIIHAHLPGAELYVSALKQLFLSPLRARFVSSRHNDTPFGSSWLFLLLERWASRQADHIICISKAVQRLFVERQQTVSLTKTSLIYYGIDTLRFKAIPEGRLSNVRQLWQASASQVVFLCIARMVPQKGIDILLKSYALARHSSDFAEGSLLVLVGTGPLKASLMELAVSLGLAPHVRWLGFREDIPELLAAADCLVLSSRYEGLGLVLLEAASASLPVIASRISAIPEIVIDGKTGILVSPESLEEFADAMKRMFDSELRGIFGQSALDNVRANFDNSRCFAQTQRLYEFLLRTDRVTIS
jgi:glycosyltransferase involved in cell wall biosynthesis